ncbi:MAG: L-histidine N(alpha)-methyltransferase [Planctomycetota bacterium]
MSAGYKVIDSRTLADRADPARDFAIDVLVGLTERPKRLNSAYFYDDVGSDLFQQIMDLYEYYPTNCERQILEEWADQILAPLRDKPFNLVDLGAGDGAKTMALLQNLVDGGSDFTYVPIDISEGAMKGLVDRIASLQPNVKIEGLVAEYADAIHWLDAQGTGRPNLVLFLGSNIGNFDKANARAFLRRIWNALGTGDYALIGFDLKKDIELLLRAYNDSHGVTASFNLNILERMNRELDANFDIEQFRHYGTYDVFSGAMKSYLVSLERQAVFVGALQHTFHFEAWEPILTEYSYKYLESDIDDLASDTGFVMQKKFYDRRRYFVNALWRVEKDDPPANVG